MPSYVITGASRGIGLEFVRQLSSNPDNTVFGLVRNKVKATDLVELQSRNNNIHIIEADILDVKALKTAAKQVADVTGGTLDVLVNNAAAVNDQRVSYTLDGYPEGEEELLEKDFIDTFKTNVVGVIHTTNAFLPLLKATAANSTAKVITLSTGVADAEATLAWEFPVHNPYSISKAAVNIVVAKYAAEYKSQNFVFLAVSPGLVNTATRPPTPEELQGFLAMVKQFQKVYPDWDGNPITPEVSVTMMLELIGRWTPENTGAFVSHYGNKKWL